MSTIIGFDATPLLGQRSGVGNYTGQLLTALLEQQPEWRYLLFSNRPLAELEIPLNQATQVVGYFPRSRWLWLQFMLPAIIGRNQPHLCHFPNGLAPLFLRSPFVLSIHDATLFLHRRYHPLTRLLAMRLMLPLVAKRAAAVITMSHSARSDLIRVLGLPPANVHVIYEAAPDHFRPLTDPTERERLKHKYGLPEEFLLYVGTIEPRKNLRRLVSAFSRLKRQGHPHQLIIAGPWGWAMDDFQAEIKDAADGQPVRWLGYVPAEDLPGLYSLASLFVFPSLYEGFGLPPLEAMACGTPVLTSNNSSLVEVCQDAAVLIDPYQEDDIADGIHRLLSDDEQRQELSRRGQLRAQAFSWQRTARETAAVYQKVMGTAAIQGD
jgi:glycosyltransferase involved in cell wall biosynthesis